MKRKITALLVMALFIFSMVPFAMAEEAEAGMVKKDIKIEPLKISGKKLVLATNLRDRQERRLKIRDSIERTRATRDIKADIVALRDAKTFDGAMSNRGIAVVEHLINHLELLIDHYESLKDRLVASPEMQKKYPNAIARINAAEEKITADIKILQTVIEDGQITREEWHTSVLPIIQDYGKQRSEVRSNEQYREIRKAHVRDFAEKFRRESIPKARARLMARGLSDADVQERVARIETELSGLEGATNEQRLEALNRIRTALA